MPRKVYCDNTGCKHRRGSVCDTTVRIGRNGKCESFEKGIFYYFNLVGDAMRNSNYIDFVQINADPDLRIGIYYVCTTYRLGFSIMEWGTSRLLLFRKEENEDTLKWREIVSLDVDEDAFITICTEFTNGILPEINRQPAKKSAQPYGWLSPRGEFTDADFAEHEAKAEEIVRKQGFWEEYRDSEYRTCRDFLTNAKGYCLIHNPSGVGGYLVSHVKPLTKRQREFLYGFFMDIGDTFKAEQYEIYD